MLLIYSDSITPRLQYILHVLFREVSMLEYRLTSDQDEFIRSDDPKLNYSRKRIYEDEFYLPALDLLYETGVREQAIVLSREAGAPFFYGTAGGDFPFDIFSAAFYLVTRYEEYLPHQEDRFGRYDHRQSLAFREGFLDRPLVNEWLMEFRKALRSRFPGMFVPDPPFRFTPTYDIDVAFAYRSRSIIRGTGGWIRDMLKGKLTLVNQRYQVLANGQRDPYDVYEWLDALHLRYRLRPIYFFLLAERQVGFDKNIHPLDPRFRDLIRYHALGYQLGVHPSWQSGDNTMHLATEKAILEDIAGREITASRQHYIRMTLPDTYRLLMMQGITDDYSMGYGGVNGFRASLSSPYSWYDLPREKQAELRIHPFCFMDANAICEEGLEPAQAFERLQNMHDRVKKTGGTLYTIFHNNFLCTDPPYVGWRELYDLFLGEVVYWDI